MKKSILVLFAFFSFGGFSCLNLYFSVDHEGHLHEITDFHESFRRFNKNFNLEEIQDQLEELQADIQVEGNYKLLSDYAVLLMKAGKVELSRDLLLSLYREYPEEYQLAANLGTAYELCGHVDSALKYIEKGIELNPNAHRGSEWVHTRILKTKQQLAIDSSYLEQNSVLKLSEEDEKDSMILQQILIQVHERFPFSPGPIDPIMASILVDLGDCFANNISIEYAKSMYSLARDYYGDYSMATQTKINLMSTKRNDFDSIYPSKDDNPMGDVIKLSPLSESKFLKDNNKNNFEMDWTKLQLNQDTLLSWVNIEPYLVDLSDTAVVDTLETIHESTEINDNLEHDNNYWMWITIIAFLFLLVLIIRYRKKRNT